MWLLLSTGLRRWVIFSLLVPLAGRLLGSLGRRVEAGSGPTKLSRGLRGAERLVSARASKDDPRTTRSSRRKKR